MSKIGNVLKCESCGQMVEVAIEGAGVLSCCAAPMKEFIANTTDAAKEKHVPVITKVPGGYKVAVGSVAHPMEEKHYIQWIELEVNGIRQFKRLAPGQAPEVTFQADEGPAVAREYCNLHGLWKA
ncbi:MAG: desulfoferrodoxin [Deltaproteobacteria bacterium]|jgi:superoxide reductase|nr:desulfoferrodoxin [Deltaproteobacteria bacterium]